MTVQVFVAGIDPKTWVGNAECSACGARLRYNVSDIRYTPTVDKLFRAYKGERFWIDCAQCKEDISLCSWPNNSNHIPEIIRKRVRLFHLGVGAGIVWSHG